MKRFSEPSTWAGLSMLVVQMAKMLLPPEWHPVADGVATAAAGLAVALTEKAGP